MILVCIDNNLYGWQWHDREALVIGDQYEVVKTESYDDCETRHLVIHMKTGKKFFAYDRNFATLEDYRESRLKKIGI